MDYNSPTNKKDNITFSMDQIIFDDNSSWPF